MSSHPPNGSALDTESTVITVGGSETPPERIQRFVDVRDELEPVARWYGLSWDSGRGATSNVGSLPARSILSRDTRNGSRTRSSWRVISSSPIAPRRFAFARLWRAVFPTVVALAFVAVGAGGIAL